MPWNITNYPISMKKLEKLVQKNIAIGKLLLADKYPDERGFPIAIKQKNSIKILPNQIKKKSLLNLKNP